MAGEHAGRATTLARSPRRMARGTTRARSLGVTLALAIAALVVAPQALAADRAHWADGYVWAYDPTAASYEATGHYAFNRTGRAIQITNPASTTGRYLVRFRGLSALLGARSTVHVTGYNSDGKYCAPRGARLVSDVVEVRCFDASSGAAANAFFSLYVTRNHADLAFAYANRPTTGKYAPAASASWNPGGGITVKKSGLGAYDVNFKGLGPLATAAGNGGHVQVNAVAAGKVHCKVGSWGGSPGLHVRVACFTRGGNPVNAKFNVLFLLPSEHLAYAWANNPTSASYTPSTFYSSNPAGGAISITRSETGRYNVSWTGAGGELLDGGNVQVTAYGSGNAQCKVENWGSQSASVRCFSPSGSLVDSFYTVLLGS